MADDGHFMSFATILLGFWLLVFLIIGGIFIYLFVTKADREKTERDNLNNQ